MGILNFATSVSGGAKAAWSGAKAGFGHVKNTRRYARNVSDAAQMRANYYFGSSSGLGTLGDDAAEAAGNLVGSVRARAGRGSSWVGSKLSGTKLGWIWSDVKTAAAHSEAGVNMAERLTPKNINNWVNTRIFGQRRTSSTIRPPQGPETATIYGPGNVADGVSGPVLPGSFVMLPNRPKHAAGAFPYYYAEGSAQGFANAGKMNMLWEFGTGFGGKAAVAGTVGYGVLAGTDTVAGYLHGGSGYGGYYGFGEGMHRERNALQGATTNTNYQGQMMGLQALSSNQVAPQYSLTIAPMRQRRATASLRGSTDGLALGLHRGRHGGY